MKENPDFILEIDNFFSIEESMKYIDYFDNMEMGGFTVDRIRDRGTRPHDVSDNQLYMHNSNVIELDTTLTSYFLDNFWKKSYEEYVQKYSIILDSPPHKIFNLKMQKINPGEGYHTWHYEASSRPVYNRLLFFILYLNSIDEGGETEFLYYKKRIKPEVGKLIMAPCGFTHTHRGNPPLESTKYILTGWVEYE